MVSENIPKALRTDVFFRLEALHECLPFWFNSCVDTDQTCSVLG